MRARDALTCSRASEECGEPLAGTAPQGVTRTMLVPHRGVMTPQPIESPGLAVPRRAIEEALAAVPGSRFHLFVAQRGAPFADSILVARTERGRRDLHRFSLREGESGEALRSMLDDPERGERVDGPIHLVCTHGKRDACCARGGTPLYAAFVAVAPGRVLRSSHLGGHRFAPVVHTYPAGLSFGRVEPAELAALDCAAAAGEVHDPERLRGVFPYDGVEQAAVTRHLQEGGRLVGLRVERAGDVVRVRDAATERVYRVETIPLPPRPASCGAAPAEAERYEVRRASEDETR